MTVYLAFNEYEGLNDDMSDLVTTSLAVPSSRNRTGFALDNPTPTAVTKDTNFTGISEGWVHFNLYIDVSNFQNNSGVFFSVLDADDNTVVSLSRLGTDTDEINVTSALSSATPIATRNSTLCTVDINIKLDATNGFIRVYIDNQLLYDLSGNTIQSTGGTTFDTLRFRAGNGGISGVNAGGRTCYSEVLVSDSNTIDAIVRTLTPTTGSINDWAAGTSADIDESDVDDTDYAYTDTNLDELTVDTSVSLSSLTAPSKYTALVQTFRASYDSGAPVTQITPFLTDTTATNSYYGTTRSLTNGYVNYMEIWDTDPADSSDWTASKINGYEFGVRAET